MKIRRLFVVLNMVVLVMAVGAMLRAQTVSQISLPAGVQRITSVEGTTEYRLANGLRVLLSPDLSSAKVTVNITYLVGSRYESYGETGMAHLLEHLMFKGTPTHPNVHDELSRHGAQANATTYYDSTTYYETFAATAATDENLEWALSLESDRMTRSFIAKKDLDSEMTVVRNEFESDENNPMGILNQRVLETAYVWHNYHHPTIGSRPDIEKVPIERLQAFYRTYYQPDNAVLIVAGNFDEQKTLDSIQKTYGSIPKPTRTLPQLYTEEPTQDGERDVVLRRVGDNQAIVAAYHVPAAVHPDTIALDVLAEIVKDPGLGLLRKRLVETKLVTEANVSVMETHDPGLMKFSVELPKSSSLEIARTELLKTIRSIAEEPVTEAELKRVLDRVSLMYADMMKENDPDLISGRLSTAVSHGDWRLFYWIRDQVQKVTIADVQRVAAKYLVPSNLTLGTFVPNDKPVRAAIPATPDLEALLKDYKGGTVVAAVERFDPTPANIEARTTYFQIGRMRLAFLPKKTRGNQLYAGLNFHFGDEASLRNRVQASNFVGDMLMRGTIKHDRTQLNDALTAIKTSMTVSGIGGSDAVASFLTDREHLAAALRLAAEVLQQPAFPEKEFDELKRSALASVEEQRTDPGAIADLALRRALSPYPPGHVNYVPTLDELSAQIQSTTLDDAEKFYHDFYGVGAAEMAFVGDFDPKEVTGLVRQLFGNWKSPRVYQRVPQIYKPVMADAKAFDTPDKTNAFFLVATNLPIRDDDPAYPALVLGNYILGGGFLNSRLAIRIRQKEGLSYGVGSGVTASALDRAGMFYASAICAPQNEPKVEKAFREEIARVLADGFTVEELADAKSGFLQERQLAWANDGPINSALADNLFAGRDFHWEEQFEQRIRALTPEQVHQAMRQFIDPGKLIVVSAGDFSRKESVAGPATGNYENDYSRHLF